MEAEVCERSDPKAIDEGGESEERETERESD